MLAQIIYLLSGLLCNLIMLDLVRQIILSFDARFKKRPLNRFAETHPKLMRYLFPIWTFQQVLIEWYRRWFAFSVRSFFAWNTAIIVVLVSMSIAFMALPKEWSDLYFLSLCAILIVMEAIVSASKRDDGHNPHDEEGEPDDGPDGGREQELPTLIDEVQGFLREQWTRETADV